MFVIKRVVLYDCDLATILNITWPKDNTSRKTHVAKAYQTIKCHILPFCHTNDVSLKVYTVDFVCHCWQLIKYVTVGWRKLGKQLVLTLEMAIGEQRTTHPQQEKTCIVFVPNLMESPMKGGSVFADVLLVRLKRCQMGPCDLWAKLSLWAWWVRWVKSAWWVKWGW